MVKSSGAKRRCPYCSSKTKMTREEYVQHYRENHKKGKKVPEFWKKFKKPKKRS